MTRHDFRRLRWGHGLTLWERRGGDGAAVVGFGPDDGTPIAQGDEILMDWTAAGGPPAVVMTVESVNYSRETPGRFGATLRGPRAVQPAPLPEGVAGLSVPLADHVQDLEVARAEAHA